MAIATSSTIPKETRPTPSQIQQQAQEAQFIVVSLRRPMIEASMRTIGVTQARGAYTQVLGIKL
ncbi:hypothetical protein [Halothece sp. PCC 7418]|uniref:hypothetical protein n=1 Tax=Halothece sp. (strain PCC 7418) TaxID=65093 RepID=UPI0002E17144|nr:hypothetical protein [Halothece sp. PCC 7418]